MLLLPAEALQCAPWLLDIGGLNCRVSYLWLVGNGRIVVIVVNCTPFASELMVWGFGVWGEGGV